MPALEISFVVVATLAIVAPYLLPLRRVTPAAAAAVWLSALALRALAAIGLSIFVFIYLPKTSAYDAVTHWCWHEVLPLIATHLGFSGHPVAHAAIALPGLVLAGSLLWVLFGVARAWLSLRPKLRRAIGTGPLGSTIISDDQILVGVPTLGRGRIVVSDSALAAMDAQEMRASLNHELGHIHRCHRPLLHIASVLGALGRPLPGTKDAVLEFKLCLERDADEYAVSHANDPLALASAICKAAGPSPVLGTTGLGGEGRVLFRLDHLQGHVPQAGKGLERLTRLVAAASVALILAVLVTMPSWALATPGATAPAGAIADPACVDDH